MLYWFSLDFYPIYEKITSVMAKKRGKAKKKREATAKKKRSMANSRIKRVTR